MAAAADKKEGPTRSRFIQALTVGLFCLAITAPVLYGTLAGSELGAGSREFRSKVPKPGPPVSLEDWTTFAGRFDRWFGDSFPFRSGLLAASNRLHVLGFGVSPTDQFLVGKDQWIFHTDVMALGAARGTYTLTQPQLDLWAMAISARAAWHKQRGTEYLFVLIPSKFDLYPERLAFDLRVVGEGPRERFSRFVRGLAQASPLIEDFCLDLEPAMQNAKRDGRPDEYLYHPYGVHWTDRGAFAAYQGILGALDARGIALEPRQRGDFEAVAEGARPDGWGRRLYLENDLTDREPRLAPRTERRSVPSRAPDATGPRDIIWSKGASGGRGLRATVHHDSFGPWLLPFLAEHFDSMRSFHGDVFQPGRYPSGPGSVVIEMYSERALVQRPPGFPVDAIQERLLAGFDGAKGSTVYNVDLHDPLPTYEGFGAVRQTRGPAGPHVGDPDAKAEGPSLLLEVTGPGNVLLLDALGAPIPGTVPVLMIDIEAPGPFRSDIFFNSEPGQAFHPHRSVSASGLGGRRRVALPLTSDQLMGPLGLRVAAAPGHFRLRAVEVRAVPVQLLR